MQNQAGDGVEAFMLAEVLAQLVSQFVQVRLTVDKPAAVGALMDPGLLFVMAFVKVAGDHFQDVGRCHHAFEGAVLVDDEGHVDPRALQDLQRLQHRGRLRNEGRFGDQRFDVELAVRQQAVQQILLVNHAQRIIDVALARHHDSRIGAGANLFTQHLFGVVQGDPEHVVAGGHRHPHRTVAQAQDFLDHHLLFGLDQAGRGAFGQDGRHLFLGHVRAIAILDAQQLENAGGGGGQQQDERLQHDRQLGDRPGHLGRHRLGEDQRQALGHQFADDQRDIGDAHDHHGGREEFGVLRQRREGDFQNAIQLARDGRLTIGARQNADQGDAHLDRGQELSRFFRQFQRRPGPPVAPFRPRLQLGFPRGDDRQFSHGEQAVEHHQEQNDSNSDE